MRGRILGSNQPIRESEEDGRRHNTGLRQDQRPVGGDDLKVSLCVALEEILLVFEERCFFFNVERFQRSCSQLYRARFG